MSKTQAPKKDQRELLFVFNAEPKSKNRLTEANEPSSKSALNTEEIRTLRQKLITELREYGC